MAKTYHEPPHFRWSLGALIQAAREVTWMVQSEKASFADFDSWYIPWQENAREVPLLKWLNVARVQLTKRSALAPTSWARFRCLLEQVEPDYESEEDEDLFIQLNPFKCTHAYIREGPIENHGHEYQRSWEVAELPGRELLAVGAEIYDLLAELVALAHKQLGASFTTAKLDEVTMEPVAVISSMGQRLPCMSDLEPYRTVRTYVREGREVWDDAPEHP